MTKRIIVLGSLFLFLGVSFARTSPELSYEEAKQKCTEIITSSEYGYDAEFESNCDFAKFNHFEGRRWGAS